MTSVSSCLHETKYSWIACAGIRALVMMTRPYYMVAGNASVTFGKLEHSPYVHL